ncbi:MAG: fibronectin type III domain-containing protein [Bacteroidales bacterium]|nr:fibronectin type III domain-containing protein [Bacteroidales bacterium]
MILLQQLKSVINDVTKRKTRMLIALLMLLPFFSEAQDWRATVPYQCNFENETENAAWILLNGDSTIVNKWYIGTLMNNTQGGTKGLYISSDTGAHCTYADSMASTVIAYRDFSLSAGFYTISYDWQTMGEQGYDMLYVALVPADDTTLRAGTMLPGDLSSYGVPDGWVNLDGNDNRIGLYGQADWATRNVRFTVPTTGYWRLVFIWHNDDADGQNPAAAVDNIAINEVTCLMPTNLAAVQDVNAITLSWTPGGSESSWLISVDDTTYEANTTTFTVSGLQPQTVYTFELRSVCGTDTSWEAYISAATGVTVPYYEDFEYSDEYFSAAWNYIPTGDSAYIADGYEPMLDYSGGNQNLRMRGFGYLVLPKVDTRVDTLQVSFQHSSSVAGSPLAVGVMEGDTFVAIDTILGQTMATERTVYMMNYTGTSRRIAFRNYTEGESDYATHYIDNLSIDFLPSCYPVASVSATADSVSATVSWVPQFDTSSFVVEILDAQGVAVRDTVCSGRQCTFDALMSNTDYVARVRAYCGEDDTSAAVSVAFATECAAQQLPYSYGFEDDGGAGRCWTGYSNNTYGQPYTTWGGAHSGAGSYRFTSDAETYSYVVMPLFAAPADTILVSLYASATSRNNAAVLVFGVMDDPEDIMTFVPVDTLVTSSTMMEFFEIPFDSYTGTGRNLAILCDSGAVHNANIDDILVEYMPRCSRVRDLEVPVVTAGAALTRWSNGRIGQYQGAQVQYRDASSDNWQSVNTTAMESLLTNLYHNTEYELRVAAICQNNDMSDYVYVNIVTAMTGCNEIDTNSLRTDTISDFSTSNHFELPVHNWDDYSFSEQLFTASELDTAGAISAIEFYYVADTLPMTAKDSCRIYLGVTPMQSIGSRNFVDPSDMTLVYEGPLNCTAGWNTFAFNRSNFNYDGRNSLVVAVVDNSGASHDEHYRFRCHSASGKAISFGSDEYAFDNYLLMDYLDLPYRNDMVFHFSECSSESECYPPMVFLESVGADSVSFTLIPGGYETGWTMMAGEMGTEPQFVDYTTQMRYTFTNLNPSTTYTFRIVGDCEDSVYSDYTVTTKCLAQGVPFFEDFSDWPVGASPIVPSCWYKFYTLGTNIPYIWPFATYPRTESLFLFSNAESYSYVALPELTASIDSLQIGFWMYSEHNEGSNDSYTNPVVLGLMTDVENIESLYVIDTLTAAQYNQWEYFEIPMDVIATDSTIAADRFEALRHSRITLLSPDGQYSRPLIDDITVEYIPRCAAPTGLALSYIAGDTTHLIWDDQAEVIGWIMQIDSNSYFTNVNSIDIGGLNASMVYTFSLRTICGFYDDNNVLVDTDTSKALTVTMRTPCAPIKHSPWVESFELNDAASQFGNTFAACWTRINNAENYNGIPYVSDANGYYSDCHTGERGLNWAADPSPLYGDYQYIVSPVIDTAMLPINTLQVNFWAKAWSGTQTPVFKVGVMQDGDFSGNTFVPVDTITINGITSWRKYTVYLNNYTGNGTRIAIKADRPTEEWEASIDDIEIKLMPLCPPVSNISATAIDTNSITITWTENGNATIWDVEYGPMGFAPGTGTYIYATSNTATLTGLSTATYYDVYVAPICDDPTDYTVKTLRTADPYFALPFLCNFNDSEINGKWNYSSGSHVNAWYIGNALGHNDNSSLYISQDGGVTNTYNRDVTGISYAYVNLMLTDTGNYNYRFDWRSNGQAGYDFLRVALVPISFIPEGGTYAPNGFTTTTLPMGWIALDGGHQLAGDTSQWTTVESEVHIAEPGIYRLLFSWYDYYIAFGHDNPAAIDNVVFRRTSCQTPSDLSYINFDTSIYVSWTANGDETQWIVSCEDTSIVSNTVGCYLTGLTPNTQYNVSVRAFCFDGDTSMAVSVPVQTTCNAVSIPFSENFDAVTTSQTTFTEVYPTCWQRIVFGTEGSRSPQVFYDNTAASSGSYSLFMGRVAYAILPPVDVPLSTVEVTFSHMVRSSGFGVQIGVMEGNTFIPIQSINDPEGSFVTHTVSFESYTGISRTIAFLNTGEEDGIGAPNFIDDISVTQLPLCRPVTAVTQLATSTTDLYIDWTDATPAIAWEIEYGPAGFIQDSGTTVTVTAHPAHITGLDTLTTYDFYVRPKCNDSTYAEWTGPTQISTAFCDDALAFSTGAGNGTSQYVPVSYMDYSLTEIVIDSAELAGIGDLMAIAFYYNHTQPITNKDSVTIWLQPTTIASFATNNSIVALDTTIATHVYTGPMNCTKGWNYFNFEEDYVWNGSSNVLVIIKDNSGVGNSQQHRFRVAPCSGKKTIAYYASYFNFSEFAPSAFTGSKGTYNYRPAMQLISCGGATCAKPTSVYASNVTGDSTTINWHGVSSTYELEYKAQDAADWSETIHITDGTSNNAYRIGGLDELTGYNFRVRQQCITGEYSEWANGTFTTVALPCEVPSTPVLSQIGYDRVTVDWTSSNAQSQWYIRISTSAYSNVVVATEHPFVLTGLTHGTSYSVSVADSCTNNGTISDYSQPVNFTTLECPDVTGVTVIGVTSTSATVTWNGSADSYSIEYGVGNFNVGGGTLVTGITQQAYDIAGLEPDREYSVYVRSECGGTTGSWSTRTVFRTSPVGIDIAGGDAMTVSIAPNPASGSTVLTIGGASAASLKVSVIDLSGRTVATYAVDGCESDCSKTLALDGLSAGTYFVRIDGDGVKSVKKLVVR